MTDFPYVLVPGKIPKLFSEIRGRGRPPKLDHSWLKAAGLKSSNDRALKGLVETLGYVGADGAPTPRYGELKGSEERRATSIAAAVRRAYSELLEDMPDAPARANTELSDYFSEKTGAGGRTVTAMVGTFKALCQLADFSTDVSAGEEPVAAPPDKEDRKATKRRAGAIKLVVNLSLPLPATENAEIYDKIFASVARHLRDLVSGSPE